MTIDRFEGNFCVVELEDGTMKDIPKEQIPKEAVEGDILTDDNATISIDKEATARRKKEIEDLLKELFE